jgi:hypothetical protein
MTKWSSGDGSIIKTMTVPKCKGRVVRDSKAYRYNETGMNQRALQKIWGAARKRELRLAKRARQRERKSPTKKWFTPRTGSVADRARGYRLVTTQVPWVSNEEVSVTESEKIKEAQAKSLGIGFLNPVTGEARWGPNTGVEGTPVTLRTTMPIYRPPPHQVHQWVTVAQKADWLKPVSQPMDKPYIERPTK